MSITVIKSSGAVAADANVGHFGHPAIAMFGEDLFAAYQWGDNYPMAPTRDYAWNGREAEAYNSPPINATDATMGGVQGYLTGFNVNDWKGAGDAVTFFAVVRRPTPAANGRILQQATTVNDYIHLNWSATQLVAWRRHGGAAAVTQVLTDPADGYRGTGYEFVGGMWSSAAMTTIRRTAGAGGALTTATRTTGTGTVTGTEEIILGASKTADAGTCIGVGATFLRGDHVAQAEAYYQAMKTWLAGYGAAL